MKSIFLNTRCKKVLERHLNSHFEGTSSAADAYHSIPLLSHCRLLISGFAHIGHTDPAAIDHAFQQGTAGLGEHGKNFSSLDVSRIVDQRDGIRLIDHLNQATARQKVADWLGSHRRSRWRGNTARGRASGLLPMLWESLISPCQRPSKARYDLQMELPAQILLTGCRIHRLPGERCASSNASCD